MGGFLAGLGAAVGGAGQAAGDYGAQIRGILEQRRGAFAHLLTEQAGQEIDPNRRAELLHHAADLYSGKPAGKMLPAIMKTMEAHHQDNQALAQAMGQTPTQATPQPQAGPAGPGEVPGQGTTVNASQPSMSPVQPQAQGQQAQAPLIPGLPPGAPQPRGVPSIMQDYTSRPEFQTPAGRQMLAPLMGAEVAHDQALREKLEEQLTTLAYKKAGVEHLRQSQGYDQLPPFVRMGYEAQGGGLSPVNLPTGFMTPRVISTGTMGEQAPPGTVEYGTNKPVQKGVRYRVELMPGTGESIWQPETAQTIFTQTPDGLQVSDRNTGQSLAPVQGAIPPAQNTPFRQPTAGGGVEMTTPHDVRTGHAPLMIPGAVSPAMLPTTTQSVHSVQTVDPDTGQPVTRLEPVTSTRTKGGVGALPPVPSAAPGAPPLPGAKEFPKFSENQLTGAGQKDVAQIDDVLSQIKRIKQLFEAKSMHTQDGIGYYPDYFKYMHLGQATPNQDLWTSLSFEGLRSAATALRGTNSRALPIITRALEHVPNPTASPTHLPDSPKKMYNQIKTMEEVLTNGRQQILADEKKSGVVKPLQGVEGGGGAVPPGVKKALESVAPGRHTLSDGSVWIKAADGNITKQ